MVAKFKTEGICFLHAGVAVVVPTHLHWDRFFILKGVATVGAHPLALGYVLSLEDSRFGFNFVRVRNLEGSRWLSTGFSRILQVDIPANVLSSHK